MNMRSNTPRKSTLIVQGWLTTMIAPFLLGLLFLVITIFVLGHPSDKLGPWGTFKVGMILSLMISVALGFGFLLGAVPSVILGWIESTRAMISVSLFALAGSALLLISGLIDIVSRIIPYPGAEGSVMGATILHGVMVLLIALIVNKMKQKAEPAA